MYGERYDGAANWSALPTLSSSAAPPPCKMSRPELQNLLERAEFGRNEAMFNCYFRPSLMPGGPPACNGCGMPISQHESGTASVATVTVTAPAPAVRIDPSALPDGMTRDGNVDRYEELKKVFIFWIVFGFLIGAGFLSLIIFAAIGLFKKSPVSAISPILMIVASLFFLGVPERHSVTFDRARRTFSYEKRKVVWYCCHTAPKEGNFDDIVDIGQHVEQSPSSLQQVVTIGLRLRHTEELVPLKSDMESLADVAAVGEKWRIYFESNIKGLHH